jgi:hypothetical protein
MSSKNETYDYIDFVKNDIVKKLDNVKNKVVSIPEGKTVEIPVPVESDLDAVTAAEIEWSTRMETMKLFNDEWELMWPVIWNYTTPRKTIVIDILPDRWLRKFTQWIDKNKSESESAAFNKRFARLSEDGNQPG